MRELWVQASKHQRFNYSSCPRNYETGVYKSSHHRQRSTDPWQKRNSRLQMQVLARTVRIWSIAISRKQTTDTSLLRSASYWPPQRLQRHRSVFRVSIMKVGRGL